MNNPGFEPVGYLGVKEFLLSQSNGTFFFLFQMTDRIIAVHDVFPIFSQHSCKILKQI